MELIRDEKFREVVHVKYEPRGDERGYFQRIFDADLFQEFGLPVAWCQGNESLSTRKNLVRGLHFQKSPFAETKYVRVVQGRAYDVFVDIRDGSPTWGMWGSVELDQANGIVIPKGFAHGFAVIEEPVKMIYQVDQIYSPGEESGIKWDDPDLSIPWPVSSPIVSEKDQNLPSLADLRANRELWIN